MKFSGVRVPATQEFCLPFPAKDPTGPTSGSSRVLRGGSWNNFTRDARSADRGRDGASDRHDYNGFRLVRELD
jgi:formylglycine-generating enzyme required for sulfatase activity